TPRRGQLTRRGVRLGDRLIGILLGILLGLAILLAFLFLGSEETIDAPSISGDNEQTQTQPASTVTR
ncbi:MAG TPA: hypothetical protein VFT14_01675, partial [Solirubrobacterales bacterium]|nr:hypothetical protein [Solirubrobacterales bacterium]